MNTLLAGFEPPAIQDTQTAPEVRGAQRQLEAAREALRRLLVESGIFYIESETARCVLRATEYGVAHWHVSKTSEVDLTPEQMHALVGFCDESGQRKIVLRNGAGWQDVEVRNRRKDSVNGPGTDIVRVQCTEILECRVLAITGGTEGFSATLQVSGEGEFTT